AIVQWPKTTAQMLAARRKSTTRSRSAGVASTIASNELEAMPVAYPGGRVRSSRSPRGTWQDDLVQRQARMVIGVALVVVGLFATGAGLEILVLVGPDGSVGIAPTRLLSSGYAVTLPQLNVPRLPGDERLRLDVTLQPGDSPLFVGVGPTPAVDAFLRGAPIDVIEQIDWPGAAPPVAFAGTRGPAPPATQPFWVVSEHGAAPALHWDAV